MTLQAEPLIGCQDPAFRHVPPYEVSSADEVAELMRDVAGVHLLPWQLSTLAAGLGMRREVGRLRWSAFEIAMILARQNGKNVVLEARELGGLFLLGEQMILHTAHQYKTSQEAFKRIDALVTNSDWLRRKVKRVVRTNGEEAVELNSGARLRFLARSKASGRGFTADCLILDEAYELGDEAMSALLPTLSTRPDPQVWYASSAGMPSSVQLGRIWRRGRKACAGGDEPSLAFFEWAAQLCTAFCPRDCGEHDQPWDPAVWARTNPSLGAWLPAEGRVLLAPGHIAHELATMSPADFARERLSVGDYPAEDGEQWAVIAEDAWQALEDARSQVSGPLAFAVEVGPERRSSAIGAAGLRADGQLHVEVIDHQPGTDWVIGRLVELWRRWRPLAVVIDPGSHAAALTEPAGQAGIDVVAPFSARDAAAACGQFYDAVKNKDLRHIGQGSLTAAVAGALTRPLGDQWAWDRKTEVVDISPLVAVTLAAWAFNKFGRNRTPPYDVLKSVG